LAPERWVNRSTSSIQTPSEPLVLPGTLVGAGQTPLGQIASDLAAVKKAAFLHNRPDVILGRRKAGMAPRINKRHSEDVRARIQTSQLINVLQDHALTGGGDMSPTRMKAIEILLRKSIPDLSAVTVGGDAENPLALGISVTFVKPDGSAA